MIVSHCLRRAPCRSSCGQVTQVLLPTYRRISSTSTAPLRLQKHSFTSERRIAAGSRSPLRHSIRHLRPASVRFASTDTRQLSPSQTSYSNPTQASPNVLETGSVGSYSPQNQSEYGFVPDDLSGRFGTDAEQPVEVYSGYLKDLGLDYGWGPTAFMETALEQVYMHTGLPWWASIIVTITAIRAVVFRFYIRSSDNGARLAVIKDVVAPLDARMRDAKATNDMDAMRSAAMEKREVVRKAGVSMVTLLLPVVIQIPLGFGTFRLMRGMTNLPVPGMDTGGFLWAHDLTIPDPYFIVPVLTGLALYKTFKLGGESGGARMSSSTMNIIAIVLPGVTTLFSCFWPAGLQLGIATGSALALMQAWLFRQVWFRDLLRMQRFPPKAIASTSSSSSNSSNYKGTITIKTSSSPSSTSASSSSSASKSKNFLSGLKEAYNDVVKQGQEIAGKRNKATRPGRSDAELKKAKAYEEKKTREAAQRRFELAQARQAGEDDRRLRRSVR